MSSLAAAEVADRLAKAREARAAIDPFSDEDPAFDLATGYAAQAVQRRDAGRLAGWKLGVTSRAKQAQVGVHEPIRGFLPASGALDVGEPLTVAEHISPRAEPEIVFVLGEDLAGADVRAVDVLRATAGVAVGIEILDSRYRDYRFTMPDVVADNASAGRFLVGTVVPAAGLDLRLVGVVLEHRGEVVATASGAASLGYPAAAVAWLVRSLAEEGGGLRAGEIVLSGGLTAAVPVVAGDSVVATIDRLGSLELSCR
jgi:2-keto-4-pentenoate hydratase